MARQAKPKDNTMLEMAIVGYQSEIDKINAKIAVIREQLVAPAAVAGVAFGRPAPRNSGQTPQA